MAVAAVLQALSAWRAYRILCCLGRKKYRRLSFTRVLYWALLASSLSYYGCAALQAGALVGVVVSGLSMVLVVLSTSLRAFAASCEFREDLILGCFLDKERSGFYGSYSFCKSKGRLVSTITSGSGVCCAFLHALVDKTT